MSDPRDLPPDFLPHDQRRARRPGTLQKLTRSSSERVLTGVLGGIAEFVGASPRAVRVVYSVATVFSGGILAIGYVLLWWLLPRE